MSVVITLNDIRAYAEVDYIINHMNDRYIKKIPEKIKKFFSEFKDSNYKVKIDPYVPLENQGLQRYSLEIIALLHLRFWCEDEKRKQELYGIMVENKEKLEMQIKKMYDIDSIFDKQFDILNENKEDNKEDFSQPRVIQKYERFTKENNDIKDYTDYEEDDEDDEDEKKSLVNQKDSKSNSIFSKIKEKILSLFKIKK